MAKKNFTGGIDSLFQYSAKEGTKEKIENKEKLTPSYSRTTLIVNNDTYEKIKAIAYWERKAIKDLIDESLNNILSKYTNEELSKMLNAHKLSN